MKLRQITFTRFLNASFKTSFYAFTALAVLHASTAWSAETLWSTQGFEEPESVLAHPSKPEMYVSNIKGHPMEKDGQGYISRISIKGDILDKEWVAGLDAPKGMAIHNGLLYVADLKNLRIIDIEQGKLTQSIEVQDSVMLNDIAVGASGAVYISDLVGGGIYRFSNNQVETWISKTELPHPNGLFFDKDHLLIATWGEGMQEDFSTKVLGSLYRTGEKKAELTLLKNAEKFGNLDGVTRIGQQIYVNDWINGNVFSYSDEKLTLVFNAGNNAADISSREGELLVPVMFSAKVDSYQIASQ